MGAKRTSLPVELGCLEQLEERGNVTMCFLANVNIEPLLVSPIEIEPTTPFLPYEVYFGAETCSERSDYPSWTINNLLYTYVDPEAKTEASTANSSLSFDLINLSNGAQVSCSVEIDQTILDRTHSEEWTNCVSTGASSPKTILSTAIMFNKEYSLLAVNQTWQCGRGGPLTGVQYAVNPSKTPHLNQTK
jgi:hypothetical protein